MPQLADPRWETFAQHRAHGKSMSEAARAADYKAAGNQGHRLAKRPDVAARIAELEQAYASQVGTNPGAKFKSEVWVTVELASIHKRAKQKGQLAVCVSALTLLARIGRLIDSSPGARPATLNQFNINMSAKEMNAVLRGNLATVPAEERAALALEAGDVIDLEAVASKPDEQGGW